MGLFEKIVVLSSAKKIRRRISNDPYPPYIVQYRILKTPSPPKKVRRLLWTAPYVKIVITRVENMKIPKLNNLYKIFLSQDPKKY